MKVKVKVERMEIEIRDLKGKYKFYFPLHSLVTKRSELSETNTELLLA